MINDVDQLKKIRKKYREIIEIVLRENHDLKTRTNELQQYSRKNNIIINGIPYERYENLYEIFDSGKNRRKDK